MKQRMKKMVGSRVFRTCMVGVMVVCLVVIALPYPVYGEELIRGTEGEISLFGEGFPAEDEDNPEQTPDMPPSEEGDGEDHQQDEPSASDEGSQDPTKQEENSGDFQENQDGNQDEIKDDSGISGDPDKTPEEGGEPKEDGEGSDHEESGEDIDSQEDGSDENEAFNGGITLLEGEEEEKEDWELFLGDYDKTSSYSITSSEEYAWFARAVNEGYDFSGKTVSLETALVLDGSYTAAGSTEDHAFAGTLRGGGSQVTFGGGSSSGLIGYNIGTISGIVTNGPLSGDRSCGSIANVNHGTISGCQNAASVSGNNAGGICGDNYGTITDCSNVAGISGSQFAGGITGTNYGTVTSCQNRDSASVSAGTDAGGIAGKNDRGAVTGCSNSGTVKQTGNSVGGAGGITGITSTGNGGSVRDCCNSGNIQGANAGGISGCNHAGSISNCYDRGNVAGTRYTGGIVGHIDTIASQVENCYTYGSGYAVGYAPGGTEIENCYPAGVQSDTPAFGDREEKERQELMCQGLRNVAQEKGYQYTWAIFGDEIAMSTKVLVSTSADGVAAQLDASSEEYLQMHYADKWVKDAGTTNVTFKVEKTQETSVGEAEKNALDSYFQTHPFPGYDRNYYDITLTKNGVKIEETEEELKISMALHSYGVYTTVLRVHNNIVEPLANQSGTNTKYVFETDKFSTYVLISPKSQGGGSSGSYTGNGGDTTVAVSPTPAASPSPTPETDDNGDDMGMEEIDDEEDMEEIEEESGDGEEESDGTEEKKSDEKSAKKPVTKKSQSKTEKKEGKVEARKLDSVPRTGENTAKGTAGLVGAVALGFYLYSRKVRLL